MRTSLLAASLLFAPALVVACAAPHTAPLTGTVVKKEYDAAKTKTKRVPVTQKTCKTAKSLGKSKTTCTTHTVRYKTVVVGHEDACYELDIKQKSGEVTEVCNEAAYHYLRVGDRYNSSINYAKKGWR